MEEWVRVIETTPGLDDDEGRRASEAKIWKLRGALIDRTRADLGLGSSLQVPPRSLLARLLGRY
jgi:hypothetical protein